MYDALERISTLLRTCVRKDAASYGLQPVQMEALHYLSRCNRYSNTPMAVSDFLGLTKGTVSQTLSVLEGQGLLIKLADPSDRRVVHLELTAAGREVVSATIPPKVLSGAIDSMSEAEKTQTSKVLVSLLLEMQKANGLKTFGVCRSCVHHHLKDDGMSMCKMTQEALSQVDAEKICREHHPSLG